MHDERDDLPGALVLSIAALDNFVFSWEDVAFEDFGPSTFLHASDFEDLSRVHVRVRPPPHDRYSSHHALVYLQNS